MELPLRTDDAHGRCDLLSSTKQLLLYLCGDLSRVSLYLPVLYIMPNVGYNNKRFPLSMPK